jgi:hypothetical protein
MKSISANNAHELLTKIRTGFKSDKIIFHSENIPYFEKLLSPKPEPLDKDELTEIVESYDKIKYQVFKSD